VDKDREFLPSDAKSKLVRIGRKLVVAVLVAFLFTLLGVFQGLGYHVNNIQELSFERKWDLWDEAYGVATFECDLTYDPLLCPFYWISGNGHVNGNFTMIYQPEYTTLQDPQTHETGSTPYWSDRNGRYLDYVMALSYWGTLPNLLTLLFLTVIVEIVGKRILYAIIFCGILGFYALGLTGALVGVMIGCLAWLLFSKFLSGSLARLWDYLFEPKMY
jgi:hypothetical protein